MMETGKICTYVPPAEQYYFRTCHQKQSGDPILKQLHKLSNLKKGWDFGEGEKISELALKKAIEIYSFVKYHYQFNVEVHPMSDGGLNLLFFINDFFVDVFINPDTADLSIVEEKGIGAEYEVTYEKEMVDMEELTERLNLLSALKTPSCYSYAPFKFVNTAQLKSGFNPMYSQFTEEEYPFLIWNVQIQIPHQVSVSILNDTICLPLDAQLCTG